MIIKPHQSLDLISDYLPENPIIVEAGAFKGSDSIRFTQKWPLGVIYAFEPVPQLFASLQTKTKEYNNIYSYNYALSNNNGIAQLYLAVKPQKNNKITQASSLLAPQQFPNPSIVFPKTITVNTITLDRWAKNNQVNHIDLLWLDLQGYELEVLTASPNILGRTMVIHLEVAITKRFHNQPLYPEVKTWLENHRFTEIARDFELNKTSFGNVIFIKN